MNSATLELSRMRSLLMMEYEEERRQFSEISERIGVSRLVDRGNAWHPLSIGNIYWNSLNQRVLEVSRHADDSEPTENDHNFEYGRHVSFFTMSDDVNSKPHIRFSGVVSYVDGNRMVVVIPDSAEVATLSAADSAGVMISFDETTYKAMLDAVDYTLRAKGRLAQLRDLFFSRRKAEELIFSPIRLPYLNPIQEKAVNKVLMAKDVAIVHGPPGTGKTTTLVEAINETLRRESQVLVCAQSNMAVDWICEKLLDRGIHVLRIGNPTKVNDKMLSFTYERRFESHPDYPDLWSIRKAIRELHGAKRKSSDQWHQKMDRLRSRATELEIRINEDLFNSAHVVASTLVGSSSRLLEGKKFSTLFIDEAAQALEAASLIPLRRAGRLILAGDHCQLPPTVKSYEAMKQGLGKSLMERLVDNHPEAVTLLSMQYRMNEEIMRFSSDWFYGGAMIAAPEVKYRGILDYDNPIQWIDTDPFGLNPHDDKANDVLDSECSELEYKESIAGASFGRINKDEARLTLLKLQEYIQKIGKNRFLEERIDVGVISPYRAQVQYMRRLVKRMSFFRPLRKLISIDTVDGFQGQERDVILISMVRSNDDGNIGFLRDLRRMNVAMTRARMKLIIIGSTATLTRHSFYRRLHLHISLCDKDESRR